MAAFKRFFVIVVAYVITVLVAALGASLAIWAGSLSASESLAIFAIFGFAGLIIGMFAAIPSAVMVMIAESAGIRSPWYYMAVAVISGVVLARVLVDENWLLLVGAALGVACGATFWAIAGRNAGSLKTSENTSAQTQLLLLLAATIVAEAVLLLMVMR
jgi:hypothetical protein